MRARRPPAIISRASCRRRHAPQRKERRQPGAGEAILAILAHVLQKQIAERDVGEAVRDGAIDRDAQPRLVDLVRARPRQRDRDERQARGLRLRAQDLFADAVHRHAAGRLVDRRQQRRRRARRRAAARAAPTRCPCRCSRTSGSSLRRRSRSRANASGCSARAPSSERAPRRRAGPGMTMRSSKRKRTRPLRTAGTEPSAFQTFSSASAVAGRKRAVGARASRESRRGGAPGSARCSPAPTRVLTSANTFVAAGGVEHVVEEPDAAARVDAAQRQPLAAEDQQRARPRPVLDASGGCRRCRARCARPASSRRARRRRCARRARGSSSVTSARPAWR